MTEEVIVADSSPLIGLARIGQLDILRKLASRVLMPPAVRDEATLHSRVRVREVVEQLGGRLRRKVEAGTGSEGRAPRPKAGLESPMEDRAPRPPRHTRRRSW